MAGPTFKLTPVDDDPFAEMVQAPVGRPPPVVRPGEEPRAQPRQRAPITRQPSPIVEAQPEPQSQPEPATPKSGDATRSWTKLMQTHDIPQGAWTEYADRYFKLKTDPASPLDDLPPAVAKDLRAYVQRFPNLGGRAPTADAPPSL